MSKSPKFLLYSSIGYNGVVYDAFVFTQGIPTPKDLEDAPYFTVFPGLMRMDYAHVDNQVTFPADMGFIQDDDPEPAWFKSDIDGSPVFDDDVNKVATSLDVPGFSDLEFQENDALLGEDWDLGLPDGSMITLSFGNDDVGPSMAIAWGNTLVKLPDALRGAYSTYYRFYPVLGDYQGGPDMVRFWDYMDDTAKPKNQGRARKSRKSRSRRDDDLRTLNPSSQQEVDDAVEDVGYTVAFTGGGCTAFTRQVGDGFEMVTSYIAERQCMRPQAMDEPLLVRYYDERENVSIFYYDSVRDFLDRHPGIGSGQARGRRSKRSKDLRSLNAARSRNDGLAKDMKNLVKSAERAGCEVIRGAKHYKVRCPGGGPQIVVSVTPSHPKAIERARADFRRQGIRLSNPAGTKMLKRRLLKP